MSEQKQTSEIQPVAGTTRTSFIGGMNFDANSAVATSVVAVTKNTATTIPMYDVIDGNEL